MAVSLLHSKSWRSFKRYWRLSLVRWAAVVLVLAMVIPGWAAALLGGGVMLAIAAGVGYSGWRRHGISPLAWTRQTLKEDIQWAKEPERVGAEPTMAGKIATATVSAGVAALIKKALARGVERLLERRDIAAKRPSCSSRRASSVVRGRRDRTSGCAGSSAPTLDVHPMSL
jgi:Putative Actinobacterial Holin-X, holin superfamily III